MNQEEKKQTLLGYLFLVPSLAVFAVFMFYPLFYTVYLSFFEWNMVKPVKKFVGLANYTAIFKDPNSWKIAGNTVVYILAFSAEFCVALYPFFYSVSCDQEGKGVL